MSFFCCGSRNKENIKLKEIVSPEIINTKRADLNRSIKVEDKTKDEANKQLRVKGIENLGNSCYISAAVQCLSNTIEFTEYILTGLWRGEVNPINPIGTDGKLLVQYVKLLFDLWDNNNRKSVDPQKFKEKLDSVCTEVSFAN